MTPEERIQSSQTTDNMLNQILEGMNQSTDVLEDLIEGIDAEDHPTPAAALEAVAWHLEAAEHLLGYVADLNYDYGDKARKELQEREAAERPDGEHRHTVIDQIERVMANLGDGESALLVIRKVPDSEESKVGEVFH